MTAGPNPGTPAAATLEPDRQRRLVQILDGAIREYRAGNRPKAKAIFGDVLREDAENAAALHFLGVIAFEEGKPDEAVALMREAVEKNATIPLFHGNLGEIYRKLGRLEEAVAACQRAVAIHPVYPEAMNTLGAAHLARGEFDEAEAALRKAIEYKPDFAPAHAALADVLRAKGDTEKAISAYRRALRKEPKLLGAYLALGTTLDAAGRSEEAVAVYDKALEIAPRDPRVWSNRGVSLRGLGRAEEALDCFRKAVELRPDLAETQVNLGKALLGSKGDVDGAEACFTRAVTIKPALVEAHFGLGCCHESRERWDDAAAAYRRALEIEPRFATARNNLGLSLLAKGDYSGAQSAFDELLKLKHGVGAAGAEELLAGAPAKGRTIRTTRFALRDRAEQIEHLIAEGALDDGYRELAARCRSVRDQLSDEAYPERKVALSDDQARALGAFFDKAVYFEDAPRCAGPAVNPDLDYAALEEAFLADSDPAVPFDDFLTPEALAGLQRFCRRATIYFNADPAGFVASSLADGFSCSLLYQIAEELKARLPRIIGPRHLSNMWVYRHAAQGRGVEAHTDHAAVTFNFWITPDSANLEPGRGGLTVYKVREPREWDWREVNTRKYDAETRSKIGALLETAERVEVPYRCNRAVLFASNMFHMSDGFRFAEGFENRRTNITMLFGRWGTGPGAVQHN